MAVVAIRPTLPIIFADKNNKLGDVEKNGALVTGIKSSSLPLLFFFASVFESETEYVI